MLTSSSSRTKSSNSSSPISNWLNMESIPRSLFELEPSSVGGTSASRPSFSFPDAASASVFPSPIPVDVDLTPDISSFYEPLHYPDEKTTSRTRETAGLNLTEKKGTAEFGLNSDREQKIGQGLAARSREDKNPKGTGDFVIQVNHK
jgi:hypothetical protein